MFRSEIDDNLGEELDWQRQDGNIVSRVRMLVTKRRGYLNEEGWTLIQDDMLDAIIRLEGSTKKYIQALPY